MQYWINSLIAAGEFGKNPPGIRLEATLSGTGGYCGLGLALATTSCSK